MEDVRKQISDLVIQLPFSLKVSSYCDGFCTDKEYFFEEFFDENGFNKDFFNEKFDDISKDNTSLYSWSCIRDRVLNTNYSCENLLEKIHIDIESLYDYDFNVYKEVHKLYYELVDMDTASEVNEKYSIDTDDILYNKYHEIKCNLLNLLTRS